jgi:hypothetical protein
LASQVRELRSRPALAAALDAVQGMGEGRPLRLALTQALARAGKLGPRERRHAAVAARGVARWLRVCDVALAAARAPRSIPADRALLRYLAWRLAVLGEDEAGALRELALPGPRRPRALSDAALASVARALPRPGPRGPGTVTASRICSRPGCSPSSARARPRPAWPP